MNAHAAKYIMVVRENGVKEAILGSPQLCALFLQILLSRGVGGFGYVENQESDK